MTRKKAKRILRWYHFFRFLTILAMIICVIVSVGGYFLTQEAYEMYISLSPATSIEERISSYQQAIGLRPDRLEAYILLLNAYGEDGSFSKTESEAFLTIYNRNHTKFNAADSNYGVLHQKAGILYVTGYEDTSSVTRLRLALPFLEIASAGITEADAQALTVRCYCQIGRYYREYVWSAGAGMKEVTSEQMAQLLSEIRTTLIALTQHDSSDTLYNRLSFGIAVCDLLFSQRELLAGTVEKADVEEILDSIYQDLPNINSVQREQTRTLLNILVSNDETYREMTLRAFDREEDTK